MRYLRVTMPDDSQWDVPLHLVYKSYDEYHGDGEHEMTDEEDLIEWSRSDMDWSEVAGQAVEFIPRTAVDYQDGWVNGEKEIVER